MSIEQARIDIMTVIEQIVADHTAYPLVVEAPNRAAVDQVAQVKPYLRVEIDYLPGGGQLDLGDNPHIRQVGQICLYAVAKGLSGTAEAGALLDFVIPYFQRKKMGIVECRSVQAIAHKDYKGWWYAPALTEFWYDRLET